MPASRRSSTPVIAGAIAVVAVVVVAVVAVGIFARRGPSELDQFYVPPEGFAAQERGAILREEPMETDGVDAAAFRVLYRSETVGGQPAAVGGFVAWPLSEPPQGGFPVVAFGHPTSGLGDDCAPSRDPLGGVLDLPEVSSFLNAGFAVAATDFPGLGPPDTPAPYLVGKPTAASMIDSVRAARLSAKGLLSTQVVGWGYSQGGHGVLWARAEAEAEAPDLEWRGTVALAPVVDLAYTAESLQLGRALGVAIAMGQATKGLDLGPVLTSAGRQVEETLRDECIGEAVEQALDRDQPLLEVDRDWLSGTEEDDPPSEGPGPVLVLYGTEDEVVGAQEVADWVKAAGDQVSAKEVPGTGHGGLVEAGGDQVGWMLQRIRTAA